MTRVSRDLVIARTAYRRAIMDWRWVACWVVRNLARHPAPSAPPTQLADWQRDLDRLVTRLAGRPTLPELIGSRGRLLRHLAGACAAAEDPAMVGLWSKHLAQVAGQILADLPASDDAIDAAAEQWARVPEAPAPAPARLRRDIDG